MLSHQQKLDFVLKMTKHALEHVQHFDAGGSVVVPQGNSPTPTDGSQNANVQGSVQSIPQFTASGVTNPIGSAASSAKNIGSMFTTQNQYQAQLAPTNTFDYGSPANAALGNVGAGYTQTQGILGQQDALAQQLQAETLGAGPNPAQNALNQNTGENIEQAAALAAGTRGAGTNAGLIASNAAGQGAKVQQQAVGQAATLQAQQQLAAQAQLQAQQQSEAGVIQNEQGIQGNLYGASANANNAQNNTGVANYAQAQGVNAQTAQANANAANKTTSGLLQGVGSLAALFAEGGTVPPHMKKMAEIYHPHLAGGGEVNFGVSSPGNVPISTPVVEQDNKVDPKADASAVSSIGGKFQKKGASSSGSSSPALLDAGDTKAAPTTLYAAQGGKALKAGGQVPGTPKVNRDAYSNDTVSAKLTPGEVVIDLDTLKDKGKLGQMARFIAANIERKKAGRKL